MKQLVANSKKYAPYAVPVISFVLLIWLLNSTNPLDVGPAGILFVFGLAYIFISSALYLVITLVLIVLTAYMTITMGSRRKIYYLSSIIAFAPVFILALNSIGQLEVKDFLLVICLVAIACFYVLKRG